MSAPAAAVPQECRPQARPLSKQSASLPLSRLRPGLRASRLGLGWDLAPPHECPSILSLLVLDFTEVKGGGRGRVENRRY